MSNTCVAQHVLDVLLVVTPTLLYMGIVKTPLIQPLICVCYKYLKCGRKD